MQDINRYIDHAVLRPELSREDAEAAIRLGLDYDVIAVCVRPADIELALKVCRGTRTRVGTVLSFPHGVGHPRGKTREAETYIDLGVSEIDMVANYSLIRSGLWDEVRIDLDAVSRVTRLRGVVLKVILETSLLGAGQIRRATEVAAEVGADFVKTSTGFAEGGATEEAVRVMVEAAAGRIQVKASGGIRDRRQAERFVEMGCARIGVGYSSTPVICGVSPSASAAPGADA